MPSTVYLEEGKGGKESRNDMEETKRVGGVSAVACFVVRLVVFYVESRGMNQNQRRHPAEVFRSLIFPISQLFSSREA